MHEKDSGFLSPSFIAVCIFAFFMGMYLSGTGEGGTWLIEMLNRPVDWARFAHLACITFGIWMFFRLIEVIKRIFGNYQ